SIDAVTIDWLAAKGHFDQGKGDNRNNDATNTPVYDGRWDADYESYRVYFESGKGSGRGQGKRGTWALPCDLFAESFDGYPCQSNAALPARRTRDRVRPPVVNVGEMYAQSDELIPPIANFLQEDFSADFPWLGQLAYESFAPTAAPIIHSLGHASWHTGLAGLRPQKNEDTGAYRWVSAEGFPGEYVWNHSRYQTEFGDGKYRFCGGDARRSCDYPRLVRQGSPSAPGVSLANHRSLQPRAVCGPTREYTAPFPTDPAVQVCFVRMRCVSPDEWETVGGVCP
ncbi:MAG: hypothetical protein D6800_08885, partial [Candidatus Zixiibacteriota bacterium]